jgi:tryptophan-rich sensory protein
MGDDDECTGTVPVWFGVVAWLAFLVWYSVAIVVAVYSHRLCTIERYYDVLNRTFLFGAPPVAVPLIGHAVALTLSYVGAWLVYDTLVCAPLPPTASVALVFYALHLIGALAWPTTLLLGRQRFLAALLVSLSTLLQLIAIVLAFVAGGTWGAVLWLFYWIWLLCLCVSLWILWSRNKATPHRYLPVTTAAAAAADAGPRQLEEGRARPQPRVLAPAQQQQQQPAAQAVRAASEQQQQQQQPKSQRRQQQRPNKLQRTFAPAQSIAPGSDARKRRGAAALGLDDD